MLRVETCQKHLPHSADGRLLFVWAVDSTSTGTHEVTLSYQVTKDTQTKETDCALLHHSTHAANSNLATKHHMRGISTNAVAFLSHQLPSEGGCFVLRRSILAKHAKRSRLNRSLAGPSGNAAPSHASGV